MVVKQKARIKFINYLHKKSLYIEKNAKDLYDLNDQIKAKKLFTAMISVRELGSNEAGEASAVALLVGFLIVFKSF